LHELEQVDHADAGKLARKQLANRKTPASIIDGNNDLVDAVLANELEHRTSVQGQDARVRNGDLVARSGNESDDTEPSLVAPSPQLQNVRCALAGTVDQHAPPKDLVVYQSLKHHPYEAERQRGHQESQQPYRP